MSYDLYVWKGPIVRNPEDAAALVDRSDDPESPFEPSLDVTNFYDELVEHFPPLESYEESALADRSVETWWSVSPERSDRFIELHLHWGGPDDLAEFIYQRARRHALVLYDPQGPDVHLPDDVLTRGGGPEGEWPPFRKRDAARAASAALIGLAIAIVSWKLNVLLGMEMAIVAWNLNVLIVSGVAIVVGLFLFVMAIATFIGEGWRAVRHRSRSGA